MGSLFKLLSSQFSRKARSQGITRYEEVVASVYPHEEPSDDGLYPELLCDWISWKKELPLGGVLEEVSRHFGLSWKAELGIPSSDLIRSTGYSPGDLYREWCLPQPDPKGPRGYCLVVANPRRVDIEAFRAAGVSVYLGSGTQVESAWQGYVARLPASLVNIRGPLRSALLGRVAFDAVELGAREVFLGHPRVDRYECFVDDSTFQGDMHPQLFEELVEWLKDKQTATISSRTIGLEGLSLALTRSFDGPVVYLSWTKRDAGNTTAEVVVDEPPVVEVVKAEEPIQFTKGVVTAQHTNGETIGRILLVDDDWRFRELAEKVLSLRGFNVILADSAREAEKLLEVHENEIDAIICDLRMPETDGRECVRRWKAKVFARPILCLTSESQPSVEEELALLGVDAFIRKDENPRILVAWVQNLIVKSRRLQEGEEPVANAVKA